MSRLLTREQAASYCGITPGTFDQWRIRGLVPGPIEGTKRWDKKAIDVSLDRLSNIAAKSDNPVEDWKRQREATT